MKTLNNPTESGFIGIDGRCAMEAIAYIFKTDSKGILYLYKALKRRKYKDGDGLSKKECDMLINALSAVQRLDVKYTRKSLSYDDFLKQHKIGRYLIDQENHVSCVENGSIVDNWGMYSRKIIGYWEITGRNSIITHSAFEKKKETAYIIQTAVKECMREILPRLRFTPSLS